MSSRATPDAAPAAAGTPRSRSLRSPRTALLAGLAAVVTAFAGAATAGPATAADGNPYQRGPDPTAASIAADRGTFATAQTTVARGNGFGGGVIYYPTDTSQGTFAAIAIAPGFSTEWSWYAWLGPRLASFGFVVIGIETNDLNDGIDARGAQLLSALDWLVASSPVRDRVDHGRLAVGGHSAGGGGALTAALQRSTLTTAIGMAPAVPGSLAAITVPTVLFGGQTDGTVTPAYLANAYATIPSSVERAYVEIAGEGHGFPAGGGGGNSGAFARTMMVWMKVFMDRDTRYSQFLCPSLANMSGISGYRASCPLDPPGAPSTPGDGSVAVVGGQSGRCLDIGDGGTVNGTQAQLWDCNSGAGQRWTRGSGNQLRLEGGRCLDAYGQGTANGTAVVVWDCNGQTNQQWNVNSNGTITGVQSGLCLDATGAGTANGTKIILWSCNGGTNQQWQLRS